MISVYLRQVGKLQIIAGTDAHATANKMGFLIFMDSDGQIKCNFYTSDSKRYQVEFGFTPTVNSMCCQSIN